MTSDNQFLFLFAKQTNPNQSNINYGTVILPPLVFPDYWDKAPCQNKDHEKFNEPFCKCQSFAHLIDNIRKVCFQVKSKFITDH